MALFSTSRKTIPNQIFSPFSRGARPVGDTEGVSITPMKELTDRKPDPFNNSSWILMFLKAERYLITQWNGAKSIKLSFHERGMGEWIKKSVEPFHAGILFSTSRKTISTIRRIPKVRFRSARPVWGQIKQPLNLIASDELLITDHWFTNKLITDHRS